MIRREEQDAVAPEAHAGPDGAPDRGRRHREGDLKRRLQRGDLLAHSPGGWHRNHQPYGLIEELAERCALQLTRAELRLEVHDSPLHLDVDDLLGADQHQIRSATISARAGHWMLHPSVPGRVSLGGDAPNGLVLPTVAQTEATPREEPHGQVVSHGESHRTGRGPVRPTEAELHEADKGLADTDEGCELLLR
jgi:hypothetical protein